MCRQGHPPPQGIVLLLSGTHALLERMASLASLSRMGARRVASVAARTAPRTTMQVRYSWMAPTTQPMCVFVCDEQELERVCSFSGPFSGDSVYIPSEHGPNH